MDKLYAHTLAAYRQTALKMQTKSNIYILPHTNLFVHNYIHIIYIFIIHIYDQFMNDTFHEIVSKLCHSDFYRKCSAECNQDLET